MKAALVDQVIGAVGDLDAIEPDVAHGSGQGQDLGVVLGAVGRVGFNERRLDRLGRRFLGQTFKTRIRQDRDEVEGLAGCFDLANGVDADWQ